MRKVEGITRRVHPKNEVWYLRIKSETVLDIKTQNKRERNMLNAIRKMLIAYKFPSDKIELTNRNKYVKNVHVSQEKLLKMKANDKFPERALGHVGVIDVKFNTTNLKKDILFRCCNDECDCHMFLGGSGKPCPECSLNLNNTKVDI